MYYTHDVADGWYTKSGVTLTTGNNSFSGTLGVRDSDGKTPQSMSVQNPGYDTTNYAANFSSTLEMYNNGAGYTAWPKTGTGVNATKEDCNNISVNVTTGYRLASITVTNPGSGYTATPTVTITGGIGSISSPAATATLGYPVASVTVTNGGDHYNMAPTVSFSGGGGGCALCSDAAATASVVTTSTTVYSVASVTLTAGGTGYTSAPTVNFSGGSGSGAAATATVSASNVTTYAIDHVDLNCSSTSTTSCIGYTTANVIFGTDGGGSGAAATTTISQKSKGTYYINSIPISVQGSGYTYDPPITISGGGGSGATATAQISGGTKYGNVWLITSLAQTKTGGRSMLQMEVASPVLGFAPGGALTLDGPCNNCYSPPNSSQFTVSGADSNSCSETADSPHPAIDGYDDPNNPTTPSSVSSIDTAIGNVGREINYTGAGGSPSVENGYASLGPTMTTPTGLNELISNITTTAQSIGAAAGGHVYTGTPANVNDSNIALGSCPTHNVNDASCHTVIDVVQGNATLNGNGSGYGILVVEGTLNFSGTFTWYGPIFVVGDGIFHYSGGGTGNIQGALFVAKIWNGNGTTYPFTPLLGSNGQPNTSWSGGGTNAINFDHCWSTNLMNAIQGTYTSTSTYKVLSLKILPY